MILEYYKIVEVGSLFDWKTQTNGICKCDMPIHICILTKQVKNGDGWYKTNSRRTSHG